MCKEAVHEEPSTLRNVPDPFKMQETCVKVVEEDPYMLMFLPDHFKTN